MPKRGRAGAIKFEQSVDDLCLPFLFDLPRESLIMVDASSMDSISLLENTLAIAEIVGIDTETEPRVRPTMPLQKTSLLQLSIRTKKSEEKVFIIDLINLFKDSDIRNRVDAALCECWRNQTIIKVAHALRGDALEICDSYPDTSAFRSIKSVLEVSALHRLMNPHREHDVSLKFLTRTYLHGE